MIQLQRQLFILSSDVEIGVQRALKSKIVRSFFYK